MEVEFRVKMEQALRLSGTAFIVTMPNPYVRLPDAEQVKEPAQAAAFRVCL